MLPVNNVVERPTHPVTVPQAAHMLVELLCQPQVHTDMLRSLRISRGVDEAKLAAGTISVEQSSSSICKYIRSKLDMETTGQFWAADTDTVLLW